MKIGQTICTNDPGTNNLLKENVKAFQIGIQALPGTKFRFNNSDGEIIIGSTGIYELDLKGLATISSIYCTGYISKTIIVDYLYEGGNS